MPITISITRIEQSEPTITGETYQHAEFIISDGVDKYSWRRGSIPLGVDVQDFLDSKAPELWDGAMAKGEPVPAEVTFKEELRQFINDNPQAKLLVTLDYQDLLNAIASRTANQETLFLQLVALWMRYQYEESVK